MAGAYRPGLGADLGVRCLCRLLLARYGRPGLGGWGKGAVAEPVLLISSDPFLGASLEALAGGRVRVARLDPSRRHAAWPGAPAGTVGLDGSPGHPHAPPPRRPPPPPSPPAA